MTRTYYFHQAGGIPGIPGIYAGVIVEVDEEHNEIIKVTPLGGPVIEHAEQPTPTALNPAPPASPTDQSSTSKE